MGQVVILTNEIKISGTYYPFNTIYFTSKANNILIFNLTGDQLYDGLYSDFTNSSNIPYSSVSAAMNALSSSLT